MASNFNAFVLSTSYLTTPTTPNLSTYYLTTPTTPNVTNPTVTNNCTEDPGSLKEDAPIVATCAIAIVFNLLILVTNINRRIRTKKRLDAVLIQFTMLALTDFLASLFMLTHYADRMSYVTKANLERMLNDRFISNNESNAILVADGKFQTYIGMGFMMIKKESAKCGEIMMRYYTLRLFGEASTRLVLVYINMSRTFALYKPHMADRSEKAAILSLSLSAFVFPGLFMIIWVVLVNLRVKATHLLSGIYFVTFIMPFFILLVTAILMIHKIQSVAKGVQGMRTTTTRKTQKGGQKGGQKGNRAERNRNQLIIVVIVVTVSYLLTHLAGLIHLIGKSKALWKPSKEMDSTLSRINSVMVAVNSLVNFPLFLCLSKQFLTDFRKLFGCFRPDNRQTRTSMDNPSNI